MANDNSQYFVMELAFEQALANLLHTSHGWDGDIIINPTDNPADPYNLGKEVNVSIGTL